MEKATRFGPTVPLNFAGNHFKVAVIIGASIVYQHPFQKQEIVTEITNPSVLEKCASKQKGAVGEWFVQLKLPSRLPRLRTICRGVLSTK
jgi:hypothetical protein